MGVAALVCAAMIIFTPLSSIFNSGERWVVLLDNAITPYNLLVASLAIVCLVAVVSQIVLIHRFTGPLVNFSLSFKKLSEGDLTREVHLREKDLLKPEADQFNEMVASLADLFEALKADDRAVVQKQSQIIKTNIDRLKISTESDLPN